MLGFFSRYFYRDNLWMEDSIPVFMALISSLSLFILLEDRTIKYRVPLSLCTR